MSQLVPVDQLVAVLGPWDRRNGPRYARLADAIQDAAHQDELAAGQRLPSERLLAERLGVSRGTVVAAYQELAERGLVERRQGSGTRLVAGVPGPRAALHRDPRLNRFVSGPAVPIDLSFGAPGCDHIVARLVGRIPDVLAAGAPVHGYAPLGLPALRAGVADLLTARASRTSPAQVMITNGAQGAIGLLSTALIRRGDRVIVEAPTYPGAIEAFSRAGAAVVGVRRDHAGPRPDELARALAGPGAALVFLVPTCHNPTGSVMHEHRRRELLALCRRHDVMLVEDQTLRDGVFDGSPPPDL